MIKGSSLEAMLVGFAAVAVIAAACPEPRRLDRSRAARPSTPTRSGTRTAAASATASARSRSAPPRRRPRRSGSVSDLTVIHRNTDAAGQLADIRTLIAQGRQRHRLQPERPGRPQPGARRGRTPQGS